MAKVEISKRLLLINYASSLAVQVINTLVLLGVYRYLAGRIPPEEYALYPVLGSVIVFLPLLTSVLTAGLSRYAVEAYAQDDERRVTQIVSTMFPLTLGAGLVILVGGGVFAWYVDYVLTIAPGQLWEARLMMALMVFSFSFGVSLAPFGVGFYIRQKFVLSNFIGVGRELLRIGLLFVLLFGVSTRVLWLVVASVVSSTCWVLATRVISRRLVPALRFRLSEIRWEMARKLVSFGGWSVVAQLADLIRTSADPLILNKLATPVDVMAFQFGSLPYAHIRSASSLLFGPLMPQLTAMYATGSKDRLRNAYLRGGRYALWVSLFMAVPLIVYCREVIHWFWKGLYPDASPVMVLLLVPFLTVYGHVMVPNLSIAIGQMRPWAIRVIGLQVLNLGLTLYLVGVLKMGAIGSALGTSVVMALIWPVVSAPLGFRLAGTTFRQWFLETLWPGVVPGLAAAAVMLALRSVVHPGTWLSLGLCAGCGMAVYAAVLFGFCMQPADRADFYRLRARFREMIGRKGTPEDPVSP